jgi:UDP-N-acetylglucosamine acyltransferase
MADREQTPPRVHQSAIVDPGAELGDGVEVGPYAMIGPNVHIGDGTIVGPHAYIEKDTRIGRECFIAKGAVLGTDPQDLKYEGEETLLIVGDRTTIREFATLNRGTRASGSTVVQMGGHIVIEDRATIGGLTAVHQFVRVGTHAFIGGGSRVSKDIPPYTRAAGSPCALYGLNTVGLERRGLTKEKRLALKRVYRTLFGSKLNLSQAIEEIRSQGELTEEAEKLVAFIEASERGVTV